MYKVMYKSKGMTSADVAVKYDEATGQLIPALFPTYEAALVYAWDCFLPPRAAYTGEDWDGVIAEFGVVPA